MKTAQIKNASEINNEKTTTHHGAIVQPRLTVGNPNDQYEKEADSVADNMMRMPEHNFVQRKCAHCEEEEKKQVQRKPISESITSNILAKGESGTSVGNSISNKINSSQDSGSSMGNDAQSFMQSRFGKDFSQVKIHTDNTAVQLNKDLNAKAFTTGNDIYFNEGQYQPSSDSGKHLLAHELAHTVQQGNGTIRRCIEPKKYDPWYDRVAKKIQSRPAYLALLPDAKAVADGIITDAKKKAGCIYYIGKLQELFETPEKDPKDIVTENTAVTKQAVKDEKVRIAKPAEAKNLDLEKKAADAVPAANWKKVKGKFGEGTYQVDNSNPANIIVKAKIFLKPVGAATVTDVKDIKDMQDGIEKAISVKGFIVSIEFVDVPDAETFTAEVNQEGWTVADHWSAASPTTLAHELLHMLAFEIDRYNYIEAHATNKSMKTPDRLTWFAVQLTKPPGFDNDFSIMGSGQHPLDDDVCTVADLPVTTCVSERQKARKSK